MATATALADPEGWVWFRWDGGFPAEVVRPGSLIRESVLPGDVIRVPVGDAGRWGKLRGWTRVEDDG